MRNKRDEYAAAAIKGRGATGAPAGRFDETTREAFDDGWPRDDSIPPPPDTIVRWDLAKTILSENDSPDIPHQLSANPYRGCEHGCVYCFARPSHAFLGLSPGLDFETKIFAKQDAAELLRRELSRPRYRPRPLSLGINTDAYQPLERKLKITRRMLEVLAECRHPVSLVTKSALIERDLDILAPMAKDGLAEAAVSLTSLNPELTRKLEPRAAAPMRRLKTIRNLAAAGVPTSVLLAPIIPAVNDGEIESLLAAAAEAGAAAAGYVVLRLPHELKEVFREWLETHMPQRAQKVMSQVRDLHGGRDYNPEFFARHRGRGVLADLIARRFAAARRRHELDAPRQIPLRSDLFRPPPDAQRTLL
ncbi:MAG: PA0069 family radical SAM protein [Gammaproteobacteria bacterium]